MANNDFQPFATGAGANVVAPSAFNPTPTRQTGFQSGIASSALANTVLRQSQFVAAMITQFISDTLSQDVLDNANLVSLEGQFISAIQQSVGSLPQAALWHFGRDTGIADVLTIPAAPIITAYADGMIVSTIVNVSNVTTTPHMSANGLASVLIVNGDISALTPGQMQGSSLCAFQYDAPGARWRLIGNVSISQASLNHRTTDVGTANAMLCSTIIPPIATVVDGMEFCIKKGSSGNTGPVTLNIGGITAALTWGDGTTPLGNGQWPPNADGKVVYDSSAGGNYRLLGSPINPSVAVVLQAAPTYFVDPGGNDANDGLTAATGRAFKTIQKAVSVVSAFNLNNFNPLISVAAGTYTGPVTLTPAYGNGTIFLTGSGVATSTISSTLGSALIATQGAQYNVSGFTLTSAAPNGATNDLGAGIAVSGSGTVVRLGAMRYGTCQGAHIAASSNGLINLLSGQLITLSGALTANTMGPGATIYAFGGQIQCVGPVYPGLTIASSLTIPYFAYSNAQGLITAIFSSITNPTNFVGQKFICNYGGGLVTNGGPAGLPGTVAGGGATSPGWAF